MSILGQIPFFKELDQEELNQLEKISIIKKYKKGEFLFMEGEDSKWLHLLLKGSLKLYKTTPKGKEIFMHQLNAMNFVAELGNFENIKFPASALFVTSGEVLKIDYEKFYKDFLSNPQISVSIIKSLSQKLKIASDVLHQELVLSSEAKVAKFLTDHQDLFNTLKHVKIASILNITPETLSRTLAKFRAQELVDLDQNNKIINISETKLKNFFDN
ncbi:putative nitrosative stress-response regulator NssR, Crp/Fnr family [Campylobacter sp. RM16187]|nr:Crp/Fnr family transcriptional regulator [Campylobacter sp. RM16187]QKG28980.1 putative nitrosative stress-response regulator NssR, Crp/Fnr family [Campylobacter sp. RM16187]